MGDGDMGRCLQKKLKDKCYKLVSTKLWHNRGCSLTAYVALGLPSEIDMPVKLCCICHLRNEL